MSVLAGFLAEPDPASSGLVDAGRCGYGDLADGLERERVFEGDGDRSLCSV